MSLNTDNPYADNNRSAEVRTIPNKLLMRLGVLMFLLGLFCIAVILLRLLVVQSMLTGNAPPGQAVKTVGSTTGIFSLCEVGLIASWSLGIVFIVAGFVKRQPSIVKKRLDLD